MCPNFQCVRFFYLVGSSDFTLISNENKFPFFEDFCGFRFNQVFNMDISSNCGDGVDESFQWKDFRNFFLIATLFEKFEVFVTNKVLFRS